MGIIEKDIGRVSIVPKGTWNNSNTYTRLDLVNYNGNSYIAKQDVPVNIEINNENYWKIVAEKGDTGASINDIRKTGTSADGLTDTYTVYFTNGETATFQVKNGIGITSITGPSTSGRTDTYTINFEDGRSTTFTIQNAKSIESITEVDVTYTPGEKDKYRINYNDGTYFDFEIQNGEDGQGLVSTVDNIRAIGQDVSLLIFGDEAPTTNTVGKLKQRYYDRTNEILYICTGIDNTGAQPIYTWQGTGVPVDNGLSEISENPVQNKVITGKIGTTELDTTAKDLSRAVNELNTNMPVAANTVPLMNGTASAGSEATFSRSDHVHPEDSNLRNAINSILLESTGDDTDRTAEIVSRLQNYKKCVLGTGTFYTTGINMPDNSSLIGSGSSTILFKSGTGDYVVNMNKNNTVSDLCIDGNTSWSNISSTIGTHHGILWNGDYSTSKDPSIQPQNGKLSNLTIQYCDGGGITCNDTGTKRYNNLIVCNVAINYCSVGIYIPFYSEYHRFTNVDAWSCYYGCINNGGNNCFANCDFSDSKTIGFVIDNSDPNNVKTNNSHATCVGCSFNHIGANDGLALSLKGVSNGFTFGNCNFFRGSVEIIDSTGVEITDSLFGEELAITISNSQAIVFSEDIFQGNPTVTRTNSTDVYFNNCFNYSTGGYIPESVGDIERRIDKNVFASTVPAYSDLSAIAEYMNSKGTGSVAFIRIASTAGSNFFKSGTGKPTLCYMLKGGPTNAYFLALTQGEASVGNFNVTNGTVNVLHDILTSESIERRYVTHAYSNLNAGANTTTNLKTLIDQDLPAGYSFLAIAGYSSGNKDVSIYTARYTNSNYAFGIKNSGSSQVSGTAVIDYLCIKNPNFTT